MPKFEDQLDIVYASDRARHGGNGWSKTLEMRSEFGWFITKSKVANQACGTAKQSKKHFALVGLTAKSNPWMQRVTDKYSRLENPKVFGQN